MPADTVALVAELCELIRWVYQWMRDGHTQAPAGASLMALDALLRHHPEARAQLLDKARQDPATAQQLKHLAEAIGDTHPAIAILASEI